MQNGMGVGKRGSLAEVDHGADRPSGAGGSCVVSESFRVEEALGPGWLISDGSGREAWIVLR